MMKLIGDGMDKYPAKGHALRIAAAMGTHTGLIVLEATKSENWPNSDMGRPFRQDRYFYYLTGCNEPDCYVTYNISDDELTLWLPPINKARVVWTGRGSTVEEALQKYDIDAAHYIQYKAIRQDGLQVTVPSLEASVAIWQQNQQPHERLVYSMNGSVCEQDYTKEMALKQAMDACRVIKDEHEIELIRKASQISGEAHTAVLRSLHRFRSEADVEAKYMQVCIANFAKTQAYDPIAGAGSHASELHYMQNDASFDDSTQLLVLDAGCEVECYASDVTRTMPINRLAPGHWPSKEAEEIYDLVEKVQEACIKQMAPGHSFVDIHRLAQSMIIDGLLELGVLTGKHKEIDEAGTVVGFFPHGLGHHMGLEVHDVSPLTRPSSDEEARALTLEPSVCRAPCMQSSPTLQSGMVVTVEPGIYFNDFLLKNFFLNDPERGRYIDKKVLKRYMHVGGVRIEDDILLTRNGYQNLTTAPKGQKMLEIIRHSAQEKDDKCG